MGSTDHAIATRRQLVADLYVQGHEARDIHRAVTEKWGEISMQTISADITHIRSKFHELDELTALDDARDVYKRRNRDLRSQAMSGKTLGKKCPECETIVYFEDPRYLKIAADLDRDAAKVDGVMVDKMVIQVEDAQKLVNDMMNAVDKHADAMTRDKILAEFKVIAGRMEET